MERMYVQHRASGMIPEVFCGKIEMLEVGFEPTHSEL